MWKKRGEISLYRAGQRGPRGGGAYPLGSYQGWLVDSLPTTRGCVAGRAVGVRPSCFWRPNRPPRDWLHSRQMTRMLSIVSAPPLVWGVWWSGSGDRGVRLRDQSKGLRQSGQCVSPRDLAWLNALLRRRFHFAVPVREVAILNRPLTMRSQLLV